MERESMEFDVVIVGAGPAGLSAACRLLQQAIKIVAIDSRQPQWNLEMPAQFSKGKRGYIVPADCIQATVFNAPNQYTVAFGKRK